MAKQTKKPAYKTFNELQVRGVNRVAMYLIACGLMDDLSIPEGMEFDQEGEVYLFQEWFDDEAYERGIRKLYDDCASVDKNILSYDELCDFDGLIPLKAKYHLGKGKHIDYGIIIDEVIHIPPDDQLTFDDDGNICLASVFD